MKNIKLIYDPRSTDREKHNVRRSAKHLAIKLLLIAHKGYKCEICEEYYNTRSLSFHHLGEEEKENDISRMVHKYRSNKLTQEGYDEMMNEVDKCVLLCENCHQRVHEFEIYNTDVYRNAITYINKIQSTLSIKLKDRFDIREFKKMYNDEFRKRSSGSMKRKLEPTKRNKLKKT